MDTSAWASGGRARSAKEDVAVFGDLGEHGRRRDCLLSFLLENLNILQTIEKEGDVGDSPDAAPVIMAVLPASDGAMSARVRLNSVN